MKKILLLLSVLMMVLACSSNKKMPTSDAEIANALLTINTEEMNLAEVALKKAQNQQVKEYARKMFKEHAQSNDKAMALRRNQNIPLEKAKSTLDMKFNVEDKVEKLANLESDKFDKRFMKSQVNMHNKVLEKLNDTLIPNAKNDQLKAMLNSTKQRVQTHLKEAKQIQSIL
jgi:putative membrane protein